MYPSAITGESFPFDNLSGDPEQEYFSDGITEDIITAISKTPKMLVIARNSTFTYKGKPVNVQQVGNELGVRYVLEGSFRKVGERVRITAQLALMQGKKSELGVRFTTGSYCTIGCKIRAPFVGGKV
jgi:adenylate cyclase